MKGKDIDIDRCYFNPKTGEKIPSHYTDGTEIKLSPEQQKKAEEATKECIKQSMKQIDSQPASRKKDPLKRGRKPVVEVKKTEEEPIKK